MSPAVQVARLMERNNLTEQQATARVQSQMSTEERKHHATVTIHNDGDVAHLTQSVEREWDQLVERAGLPRTSLSTSCGRL